MGELFFALKVLKENKKRILFPIIGIILGVATIITIISLSRGGKLIIERDLSYLDENSAIISSENTSLNDIDYIESLSFVDYAIPKDYIYRDNENEYEIYITSKSMRKSLDINQELINGDILLEETNEQENNKIQVNFQGKNIWLNKIGTYTEKNIFRKKIGVKYGIVDISTFKYYVEQILPRGILIKYKVGENIDEAVELTINGLKKYNYRSKYKVISSSNSHGIISKIKKNLNKILITISAIVISFGGIGMSNFMASHIEEKTGQIGILKAMGINSYIIFKIFFIEILIISFLSTILGIVFGFFMSKFLGNLIEIPAIIKILDLLIIFCMTTFLSGILGIIPARNAAALEPIKALKRQ